MSPMPRKDLAAHQLNGTKPSYVEPACYVPAGRPCYPAGISGKCRSVFKRLVKMLEERKSITPGDEEILRLYAVLYDRHAAALEMVRTQGAIVSYTRLNNNGQDVQCEKPNLHLKICETSEQKMLACLSALGLTPLSRSKVRCADVAKEEADPRIEALLHREVEQNDVEAEADQAAIDRALEQVATLQ
jgi:P27 family predicted phage terminase small subunit